VAVENNGSWIASRVWRNHHASFSRQQLQDSHLVRPPQAYLQNPIQRRIKEKHLPPLKGELPPKTWGS
jgi:hypothetical protein